MRIFSFFFLSCIPVKLHWFPGEYFPSCLFVVFVSFGWIEALLDRRFRDVVLVILGSSALYIVGSGRCDDEEG